MKGSSLAGMPCKTSSHSSSGMREGHTRSRTLDIFDVKLEEADREFGQR